MTSVILVQRTMTLNQGSGPNWGSAKRMTRALRPRLIPLTITLLAHALVVGAMLSAFQVGAFPMRATPNAVLERASPVLGHVLVFIAPNRLAAALSSEPLNPPGFVGPALEPISTRVPFPEPGLDVDAGSIVPQSLPARPGTAGVHCEVHIHQDAQGRVQAIDLGACTEDAAWQRTLLSAVARAAALATPSSAVHSPELTLTLNTNHISPVALAHVLSDPSTPQSKEIPENIVTYRQQ